MDAIILQYGLMTSEMVILLHAALGSVNSHWQNNSAWYVVYNPISTMIQLNSNRMNIVAVYQHSVW